MQHIQINQPRLKAQDLSAGNKVAHLSSKTMLPMSSADVKASALISWGSSAVKSISMPGSCRASGARSTLSPV